MTKSDVWFTWTSPEKSFLAPHFRGPVALSEKVVYKNGHKLSINVPRELWLHFSYPKRNENFFFQRFYCGLPLRLFYYLSRGQDALAERIKIFSNFLQIKNWQNFAFFKFWRRSHQSHIVWPPPLITTYINHKPISLLETKNTSQQNNKKHLT